MASVDDRIVELTFKNKAFESAVSTTLATLQKLQSALNFKSGQKSLDDLDASAAKFSLGNIGSSIDDASKKFSVLGLSGVAALATLVSKAVDAGLRITKALTIEPVSAGLKNYETQINAVQTILANTSSEGTKLADVNKALAELNTYANQTVYNFSDMTKNIGTFTAAGVDLQTSVNGIKGIANLAALSGSSAEQASTAMYQLSQAIAAGKVGLQDWNSVVNAGLGGKVFQKALYDTAVQFGTIKNAKIGETFDQWTAAGNSFRGSLQDGWLTSKVLTSTLSQFTGDLTDAQLASQGFTKDQIKQIQAMAKTASAAATNIKTLSQLQDALKEEVATAYAAIFKTIFGDINGATKLFSGIHNVVENALTSPIYALNNLLEGAVKLGARQHVIDGFASAFKTLGAIAKSIGGAFREIFPATTAAQVNDLAKGFANFTKALTPSKTTLTQIHDTFAGLFAVLDIGKQIVKGIFTVIGSLFKEFDGGGSHILKVSSAAGNMLVAFDNFLKKTGAINNFFIKLGGILSTPIDLLKAAAGYISNLFGGFNKSGSDTVSSSLGSIADKLKPLTDLLGRAHDAFDTFFQKLGVDVQPAVQAIADAFSQLGTSIGQAIQSGNFGGIFQVINTGLLGGILLLVKKFFSQGIKFDVGGEGFLGSIKETFEGLTGSMKAMQTQIKAKTLLLIAGAIGILTASVVALSLINPDKLAAALKAMAVGFGELLGAMAILTKISGAAGFVKIPVIAASMVLLASAIDLLVIAVGVLGHMDWKTLLKGLAGVGVLLAEVSGAALILSKNSGSMISAGVGITAMAVAINILALAVKQFATLSWQDLAKGLAGVAGSLVVVAGAMRLMPNNLLLTGTGLLAVSAGINALYLAVKEFSSLDLKSMATGIGGIAASIVAIGLAMKVMPKGLVVQAAGLIVLASALLLLQKAVSSFGGMSWSEIGKGLAAVAASLGILALAMYAMDGALSGAAATLVVAGALTLLVPVIQKLAHMSWTELAKGLGSLVAIFAVLAVAGIAMGPTIPILLALGVAIGLIGAGVLAAGTGLFLLAEGLAALAKGGAAGIAILLGAVDSFIAKIPELATSFALGIVNILNLIAKNGPSIVKAFGAIIFALVGAITQNVPAIGNAISVLITAALKVISDKAPDIIAGGLALIKSLLSGISTNAYQIVSEIGTIVVKVISAIANKAKDIVAAGAGIIVNVVTGLANSIGKIVTAGGTVIAKFISGIANGLGKIIDAGANLIVKVVSGIGNNVGKIVTAGADAIISFVKGLGQNALKITNAAGQTILTFLQGLDTSIRTYEPQIISAAGQIGIDIVSGILNGLGGLVGSLTSSLKDKLGSVLSGAKSWIPGLGGPAHAIGEPIMNEIASGVNRNEAMVSDSLKSTISAALKTAGKNLGNTDILLNADLNPTITPVLDLSNVQAGASKLTEMLATAPINPQGSFGAALDISAAEIQDKIDAQTETSVAQAPTTEVKFEQNNYSPKALSPVDIYRQTRTQLAQAKEALSV